MTTKHRIIRKVFPIIMLIIAMMCSTMCFDFLRRGDNALAYSPAPVSFADPNFINPASGSYPKKPTGFTASNAEANLNLTAGVIDISSGAFQSNKTKYNLNDDQQPRLNSSVSNTSDTHVLMINSKDVANSYGYKSDAVTLDADSYYSISVDVLVDSADASRIASLYLTGSDFTTLSIENIFTQSWQTYTFFLHTTDYATQSISLEMYLGKTNHKARGIVYFDNIVANKVSANGYYNTIKALKSSNNTGFVQRDMDTNVLVNAQFSPNNWSTFNIDNELSSHLGDKTTSTFGTYDVSTTNISVDGKSFVSPGTDLYKDSRYSIGLINHQPSKTVLTSDVITIGHQEIQLLTLYAKLALLSNGTAMIKVVETDASGKTLEDGITKTLNINTTTSATTNDYQAFSVYIKGSPTQTKYVRISIGMGIDNDAVGRLFISRYTQSLVPYTAYSTSTTSASVEKLDFAEKFVTSSVDNAAFNLVKNETTDIADRAKLYPTQPTGWTGSDTKGTTMVNGVISTLASDYNAIAKTEYSGMSNPGIIPGYSTASSRNHVLMMGNKTAGVQSYKSSDITLTAEAIVSYSVHIQTRLSSGKANLSVKTSDGLVLFDINNIDTAGQWATYTLYFKNTTNDLKVNIYLGLGDSTTSASGYAYFDNVLKTDPTQVTLDDKKSNPLVGVSAKDYVVDLSTNAFIHNGNTNDINLSDPLLYSANHVAGSTSATGGVLNTGNYDSSFIPVNPIADGVDDVLVIRSGADTMYNYTSKLSYTFKSGSYYKVSIKVYTHNIRQMSDPTLDDEGEVIEYGASVSIGNFKENFVGIRSNKEWKEYIFYIAPTSDTTSNFVLQLGSTDAFTSGYVFFTNPVVSTISTQDDFNSIIKSYGEKLPGNVLSISAAIDDSEDKPNSGTTDPNFILISSLITGMAVIVAIVGVLVRRIKWKKIQRKKSAEYDRDTTLVMQTFEREAIEIRDERVRLLSSESESLNTEKSVLENNYKHLLSNLRQLKMNKAGGNVKLISDTEREIKSDSSRLKKISKRMSKIELDIDNMSTEQYLYEFTNWLMRKSKKEIDAPKQPEDKK